jgi:catechol 2,3-dioxygenase-like lactoylglutathione lyase family enzyme
VLTRQDIPVDQARHGTLHHVEMWVPNLDRASATWGWLLGELGYDLFQDWPGGKSWRSGPTYIVFEQSPARTAIRHDRCRPGLNHLAFHVESRARADALAAAAAGHGWRLMFAEQHPYAGGKGHYAAYLENVDGYEAELVAPSEEDEPLPPAPSGTGPSSGGPAGASPSGTVPSGSGPATPASPPAPVSSLPPGATPAPGPAAGEQRPPAGPGAASASATAPPAATPPAATPPASDENDTAPGAGGVPPASGAPPAR